MSLATVDEESPHCEACLRDKVPDREPALLLAPALVWVTIPAGLIFLLEDAPRMALERVQTGLKGQGQEEGARQLTQRPAGAKATSERIWLGAAR
jgi:hypothetical protein